jgi:hypothetical protein
MTNVRLRSCFAICALLWTGCGSNDGDSSPNTGGAQNAGNGGTGQGGSNAGGSTASGGASSGAGGTTGSGGASGGAGGAAAGAGGGLGGDGGAGAGAGGGAGTSGGTAGDTFACGPLSCQSGEQVCRRIPPALPGGNEQRMCEAFPDDCAAHDCSCFCESGASPPCTTPDFCLCSGQAGEIQLLCAGV